MAVTDSAQIADLPNMNFLSHPALLVLIVVLILIAVRRVGRFRFQIWQAMALGAIAVLALGAITPKAALRSINLEVMLFLFGMFVIGEALRRSGYLYQLSHQLFRRAQTTEQLVLIILYGIGILSALLMNDTLAIICTPLMLYLARQHGVSPKLLLLALAFAITTGSVLSPLGNPQNLLVAVAGGFANPFLVFLKYLAVPTLANLFVCSLFLKRYYRDSFSDRLLNHSDERTLDAHLTIFSRTAIWTVVLLIGARILSPLLFPGFTFSLSWISLISAAPILLFSRRRFSVLGHIDWTTLIFFASMFVLMEAVWETGLFQSFMNSSGLQMTSTGVILGVSVLVSQVTSNVPYVALTAPHLAITPHAAGIYMALAAGSTISGNMLILGAASNVIIIQNAEKEGETLTFWEFARIGVPMTIVQVLVYWGWLALTDWILSSAL
jgi:Na+/H+ antiporter NhaD/arsenite permease-like protein